MANFLILFLLITFSLEAEDCGNFGETFPILEEDFIEVLKGRLELCQYDENKQTEIRKSFIETIKYPKGKSLPKAKTYRNFEYDPTLIVNQDIKDNQGRVIVHTGTKVNPLDQTPLLENLLFFDGNDQQQISWAKNLKGKWILTNGNPLQLEEDLDRPVYFDQGSNLIRKLGIQSLPAKVSQQSNTLLIEEIPCL
jgi:conjugal transfer pilus assembly protein TraW